MKNLFHVLIAIFLSYTLASCSDDTTDDPINSNDTIHRTVLVYMAAQNSLKNNANSAYQWGFQMSDSAEIMNGRQYISDNDRLLLFIDDGEAPRLYRVAKNWDKPHLVTTWEKNFCSTDPSRFQEVLQKVKTDFPAQEYGLVMWSHADGWLAPLSKNYPESNSMKSVFRPLSYGSEKTGSGTTQMAVEDLATAINNTGTHLKYIMFDCCLMGQLEVAYALRNVSDYTIASPMSIADAGGYYTNLLQNGLFATSPETITKTYYTDVASTTLSSVYNGMGIVISCIDNSKLQDLADVLKSVLPNSALAGKNSPDMSTVLNYQAYSSNYYYRPHNYDALQAFNKILSADDYEKVRQALDNAVVSHYGTSSIWIGPYTSSYKTIPVSNDNFRSVSMFIPQQIYTTHANDCIYSDLNEVYHATEWYTACGMDATGW